MLFSTKRVRFGKGEIPCGEAEMVECCASDVPLFTSIIVVKIVSYTKVFGVV